MNNEIIQLKVSGEAPPPSVSAGVSDVTQKRNGRAAHTARRINDGCLHVSIKKIAPNERRGDANTRVRLEARITKSPMRSRTFELNAKRANERTETKTKEENGKKAAKIIFSFANVLMF